MKIPARIRYSIRILAELASADSGSPQSLRKLSESESISMKYMKQIMPKLESAGLVKSVKGVKGGYMLGRDSSEITIKDVFKALGGDMELAPCIPSPSLCEKYKNCKSRKVWETLNSRIIDFLEKITIKDLLENNLEEEI
jgi:Rrf2 family protein